MLFVTCMFCFHPINQRGGGGNSHHFAFEFLLFSSIFIFYPGYISFSLFHFHIAVRLTVMVMNFLMMKTRRAGSTMATECGTL